MNVYHLDYCFRLLTDAKGKLPAKLSPVVPSIHFLFILKCFTFAFTPTSILLLLIHLFSHRYEDKNPNFLSNSYPYDLRRNGNQYTEPKSGQNKMVTSNY